MRFLAYSDIHHDEYNNGITIHDTIDVEQQITTYAHHHEIKTVFFLGDWYRATNPLRSVIAEAERAWKLRSSLDIATYVLVGNHDRWSKSAQSGHAFVSADIFSDFYNITVIDKFIHLNWGEIEIVAIPAGHESYYVATSQSDKFRLVLFHGLLAGSALANGGAASSGIKPSDLACLRADLIIGGDNHTYQDLYGLLGTRSFYLGAPLQHNWGDRGQVRGFWDITIQNNEVRTDFIPTKSPRFLKIKVAAKSEIEALNNIINEMRKNLNGNEGILEITLMGANDGIDIDFIEQSILQMNVRRVKIIIDHTFENVEVASGISATADPLDRWNLFVTSDNTDRKALNPKRLSEIGSWALESAKTVL